jgi:hypothetical protein
MNHPAATWLGLIREIFTSTFGHTLGAAMVVLVATFGGMVLATPFLILSTYRRVRRLARSLASAEERLQVLATRQADVIAIVQSALRPSPPEVRFGPGGPAKREGTVAEGGAGEPGAPGAPAAVPAGAPPEGQGQYNYCPACREIRFIKFLKCQTCGFHVLPAR